MTIDEGTEAELQVSTLAVGGDGVGRDADGRVVFVSGALPGETVRATVRSAHARFAHADATAIIDPSPDRIEPVCPHARRGCGGCPWAHVDPASQPGLKVSMVAEALERLGGLHEANIHVGPSLTAAGYRTTVRVAVTDGRAGFRRLHSDQRLAVDSCRVAHPLVESMLVDGRWAGADEVTLRAGARTGERLARVAPNATGVELPADVRVVGTDELRAGRRAWIHEVVADVRLRISADSFFQSRPDGAEALVAAVGEALADAPDGVAMVDLYGGVGLFAATVGRGRRVELVERSRSSIADARINLAELDASVVATSVERWRASAAGVVVADPPRSGLARRGVEQVGRTGASHLALVSCDAGSLGRDAALLTAGGWRHEWSRLVDLFPDTPHVEVVSRFVR
jgi:23S rRNA (uracil1939-C5)-methyltransferase